MQALSLFPSNAATQHSPEQHSQPSPYITQWRIEKNSSDSAQGDMDYRPLLLPVLAWKTHHNNQRWVTWIASQFIDKPTLQEYGVNLSSLRMIVDSQSAHSSFKLLLTALKNNRSELVIASLPSISSEENAALEQAAAEGNCQAIILIHA